MERVKEMVTAAGFGLVAGIIGCMIAHLVCSPAILTPNEMAAIRAGWTGGNQRCYQPSGPCKKGKDEFYNCEKSGPYWYSCQDGTGVPTCVSTARAWLTCKASGSTNCPSGSTYRHDDASCRLAGAVFVESPCTNVVTPAAGDTKDPC